MIVPIRNGEEIDSITEFFGWIPWEWFVTLDLKDGSSLEDLEWFLKKWRRNIFNMVKGQVAYEGIFMHQPNKHAHILMLSKPNRYGNSLGNLSQETITELKKRWYQLTERPADIRPVSSSEGVAAYMTCRKNIGGRSWEMINPCGMKLLKNLKKAA